MEDFLRFVDENILKETLTFFVNVFVISICISIISIIIVQMLKIGQKKKRVDDRVDTNFFVIANNIIILFCLIAYLLLIDISLFVDKVFIFMNFLNFLFKLIIMTILTCAVSTILYKYIMKIIFNLLDTVSNRVRDLNIDSEIEIYESSYKLALSKIKLYEKYKELKMLKEFNDIIGE